MDKSCWLSNPRKLFRPLPSLSLMWIGSRFLGGPENAAKTWEEADASLGFVLLLSGLPQPRVECFFLSWKEGGSHLSRVSLGNSTIAWGSQRRAWLIPLTKWPQIILIRRRFFSGRLPWECLSSPRGKEIYLGLIIHMSLTPNVSILQEALFVHYGGSNKSKMRVTLHYTLTHCTLVRLWRSSPVYLCRQTEERRVDLW